LHCKFPFCGGSARFTGGLDQGGTNGLEEAHFISNLTGFVTSCCQGKGFGKSQDCILVTKVSFLFTVFVGFLVPGGRLDVVVPVSTRSLLPRNPVY